MKTMSLRVKLIIFLLLAGLIFVGVIGIISYLRYGNALSVAANGQLKGYINEKYRVPKMPLMYRFLYFVRMIGPKSCRLCFGFTEAGMLWALPRKRPRM